MSGDNHNAPLPINVIPDRRFQRGRFGTLPKRKAAAISWHIEFSLAGAGKATQLFVAGWRLPRSNEGERSRIRFFDVPYHKRDMAPGWSQRIFWVRAPVASTLTEPWRT